MEREREREEEMNETKELTERGRNFSVGERNEEGVMRDREEENDGRKNLKK
jgi:hypothetical protein